jgi:hypothetical protein
MWPKFTSQIVKSLPVSLRIQGCRTITTHKLNQNKHYDVIVSGGGMVGFAMGCSLGKSIFCL